MALKAHALLIWEDARTQIACTTEVYFAHVHTLNSSLGLALLEESIREEESSRFRVASTFVC